MWKRTRLKIRIAMILTILAVIATFVNFFIHNDTVNLIIYAVVVIGIALDMVANCEDINKATKNAIDAERARDRALLAMRLMKSKVIRRSDSTLFTKKEMLDLIDEAIEDAEKLESEEINLGIMMDKNFIEKVGMASKLLVLKDISKSLAVIADSMQQKETAKNDE